MPLNYLLDQYLVKVAFSFQTVNLTKYSYSCVSLGSPMYTNTKAG